MLFLISDVLNKSLNIYSALESTVEETTAIIGFSGFTSYGYVIE